MPKQTQESDSMKKIICILLLLFGTIHCYSQVEEFKMEKPIEVKLEKLIKHSKRYNKKNVLVGGYAKFEKGISRVFISIEDFEKENIDNSVCFVFLIERSTYRTVEKCNGKYIVLSGIYIPGKALDSVELKNGILNEVSIESCGDNK
jgi:hypothetical protein